MFGRWWKHDEQHAAKEHHALDPRVAVPSVGYRFAQPVEIVEDEETALTGPGGSPEDPLDAQRVS